MKPSTIIIASTIALLGIGSYYAYITGITKSFQTISAPSITRSSAIKKEQKDIAKNARARQKQMMADIRQKIKDNRHN